MSLLKVFTVISGQFETASRGIRSLHPAPAQQAGEKDWWKESGRLHQEVFALLAAGEGLPFFRQNYLEVSSRVFLFAAGLKSLGEQFPSLSAAPLQAVGECLRNTDGAFASLRTTWGRFLEDTGRADREASASLPLIIALQESVSRLRSRTEPATEIESVCLRWGILADKLFEIDLALKKMIAVAKV